MNIYKIVNSVFTSNTYILKGEDKNLFLIDIGDFQPVKEFVDNISGSIKAVFLTHTHYDHIYGIKELILAFPDCIIYTSCFGQKALGSDNLNFSRYHNDSIMCTGENIRVLHENSRVNLFPENLLEVIETPGHDKSCLTYKIGKCLFTGDSFIPGVKTIASFPNSNKTEAESSKLRILSLSKDSNLYPGHGVTYTKFQPEKYR